MVDKQKPYNHLLVIIETVMPSAKPDYKEVYALRKKRGLHDSGFSTELYVGLHAQCISAVAEGYISQERASVLLDYLQSNPRVAAIFPNNVLTQLLQQVCTDGGWSLECEHDLLHLIYLLYLGYEPASPRSAGVAFHARIEEHGITISSESLTAEPRPPMDLALALNDPKFQTPRLRAALLSDHVDSSAGQPDLRDRFVGFTGKFQFGSRASCFAEARRRGAVPCDPAPYMDYLFLSSEFEKRGAISSKLNAAIFYRRVYGAPLILREQVWNIIASDG